MTQEEIIIMEAPKNIWLSPNEYRSNEPSCFWSESQRNDYDIEYIRKDAFIEKAEKWLKEHVLEYTPELNFGVWKTNPDYYTKHFIEDFKKYMEE